MIGCGLRGEYKVATASQLLARCCPTKTTAMNSLQFLILRYSAASEKYSL
jgi:hypothetical protein